jgi:RecB family exonuclease
MQQAPVMPGSPVPEAGDTALEELGREIDRAKKGDPLAPVTVVAPSEYAAVFVRRALTAGVGPGGGRCGANITWTTVTGLVRTLGGPALAARGLRLASPAADREVIATRARATPGWLRRFSSHPSAPVELQRALAELRRCPPQTLEALGRGGGRGADLVGLLAAVGVSLHACGLADGADLASEALTVARDRSSVAARARLGPVVTWQLGPLGPREKALLGLLGGSTGGASGVGAPTLTEVRPCADPEEEARSTVRSIIAAAEAGVPLWQQAVFHPPGPTYPRVLDQQMTAAGIAANGPGRRHLHRTLAGRVLLDLLELAGGDWPRNDVMAWLSSAPISVGPGGRSVPAMRWDILSAAAGVVGGVDQWRERLGRAARGTGPDADDASALAAFVEDLVRRTAPPGTRWSAWAAWAADLLDHYLHPGGTSGRWPVAEEAAARQIHGVLSELGDLDGVAGEADLASFRQALRTQLEETALDTSDQADGGFGDGVFVAPYAAARGLRFHAVVVAGLADNLVPGRGPGDGLLGEDIRRSDASGALATRSERREAARGDLWCAVAAGAGDRVGTLPRSDARTGRTQVPSRWLRHLVDPGTRWQGVDSFAAGLAGGGPALSVQERDLRRLDRWVRAGGDPACIPSSGDDRLARGFEAARGRAGAGFTRFDGLVGRGRVSALDPGAPVSATRFETYAKCPRRYLFDRVLRVSERVRPEELWRIEPITRGSLVHEILEAYVAERVDGAERSRERLLAIAAARLDEAERRGQVGKPLLWRIDRSAILRDLARFHVEESGMEPIAAELSFGAGEDRDTPPVTVTLDDGRSVAFQGSVDRVDRTSSGQLMVSDYKTGRQTRLSDLTRDPVAGGKLLQLPLYAMAARERFGGPRPVHARYWLLSGERSSPCFHLVITDEVERRFRYVVRLIADGVEGGCFPGIPGTPTTGGFAHCSGCHFDSVCPASRDREWSRAYNTPELRGVVALVNGEVPDGLAGSVVRRFVDPDDGGAP